MFEVQKKQCDQCLFSENKIVEDGRKMDIIRECVERETYFVCHKQQMQDEGDFGLGLCCRGFFDAFKTQPIRMAIGLKVVEFVEVK